MQDQNIIETEDGYTIVRPKRGTTSVRRNPGSPSATNQFPHPRENVFNFNAAPTNSRFPREVLEEARQGLITEKHVFGSFEVDMVIPPGLGMPGMIQYAQEVYPQFSGRLRKIQMAHMRFSILPELFGKSNMCPEYEPHYQALFDDLVEHESFWFEHIFKEGTQDVKYCEYTVGIIGTYCTLLRQRGDMEDCMKVMGMYTKVIQQFQKLSHPSCCNDRKLMHCCGVLTYKYYMIRVNAGFQLRNRAMAVDAVRRIVAHEQAVLGDNFPTDYGVGVGLGDYSKLFAEGDKDLSEWTDGEIWTVVKELNKLDDADVAEVSQLNECAHCKKKEKTLDYLQKQFKFCASCKEIMYTVRESAKRPIGRCTRLSVVKIPPTLLRL